MFVSQTQAFTPGPGAARYDGLHALGELGRAFGPSIPSRGDLNHAVHHLGGYIISNGKTAAKLLPILLGQDVAAAKRLLGELGLHIDLALTQSEAASRRGKRAKQKELKLRAQALKVLALYTAARFHLGALTRLQRQGLTVNAAQARPMMARLADPARTRTAEAIPEGVPDPLEFGAADLALRSCDLSAADDTEIGAALTGYAAAVSPESFDGDADEEAQILTLIPAPDAATVEAAGRVYPGAAQALQRAFAAPQMSQLPLATQAFNFLRKERLRHADSAWTAAPRSDAQHAALRSLEAADALILHWAERFQAHAVVLPPAAAATSAVLRTRRLLPALFTVNPAERSAQAAFAAARSTGSATAEGNPGAMQAHKTVLQRLLQERQGILTRLVADKQQAADIFAIEVKTVEGMARRAALEVKLRLSNQAPDKARIAQEIGKSDQQLIDLRGRRRLLLRTAKQG